MAVERVVKVLIAVHRGQRDRLARELQREGVLHITSTEERELSGGTEAERKLARVSEAIEQLGPLRKEKQLLLARTPEMSREEFEQAATEYDAAALLDRLAALNQRRAELDNRLKALEAEKKRLFPWHNLRYDARELYTRSAVTVASGLFADESEFVRVEEALAGLPAAIERVGMSEAGVSAVVVFAPERASEVNTILAGARFEPADLRPVQGKPAEILIRLEDEEKWIQAERLAADRETAELAGSLDRLKVAADVLATEHARQAATAGFRETRTVTLITGWVRNRHLGRLEQIVEASGPAALARVQPDPGEEPPVALANRRLFRPFELVLELFSLPAPRELDPTVLLAPFFALFFAFCLTDAGYGIVLGIGAWLLMRRLGTRNKLLGMLVIGGIVTVFAGAIVGSWFGDLPDRLGLAPFLNLKNSLMLFDPVKNPMPFFILSVAFGYVHMMYGIVIEIADCLRLRQYGNGLLGQLPWFTGINGLVALVLAGRHVPEPARALLLALVLASAAAILVFTRRARETAVAQALWFGLLWFTLVHLAVRLGALPPVFLAAKWAALTVLVAMYGHAALGLAREQEQGRAKLVANVLGIVGLAALALYLAGIVPAVVPGAVGAAFYLVSPAGRTLAKKFVWGGYALYGATSYIGVVLSYIRIMALGMVTGGIAMAINTIAWMVLPIPVAGILLALIVLVFGHTYNIAVNVLGAFVHTLRLNYVEFFPRFYVGGGEPFAPFREEHRYVAVK